MKYYNQIIDDEYCGEINIFVCELTLSDFIKAKTEYYHYMNKCGQTYERDVCKKPCLKNFFKLYFGIEDYDIYVGETYKMPSRYVLPTEKIAKEFFDIAKGLEYHDKYNQVACIVEQNENIIDIYHEDY